MEWPRLERRFWLAYAAFALTGAAVVAYLFHWTGLAIYVIGIVGFAAEFKLLAIIVGLITLQVKANPAMIALIFIGKLGIWIGLVGAPFWLPQGHGWSFASSAIAFLLALFVLLVFHGGLPRLEKRN